MIDVAIVAALDQLTSAVKQGITEEGEERITEMLLAKINELQLDSPLLLTACITRIAKMSLENNKGV